MSRRSLALILIATASLVALFATRDRVVSAGVVSAGVAPASVASADDASAGVDGAASADDENTADTDSAADSLTLIYTIHNKGYIEPCG